MIKIATLFSILFAGTAHAATGDCWPSTGNWVNAATYSCPVKDKKHIKREEKNRCESRAASR